MCLGFFIKLRIFSSVLHDGDAGVVGGDGNGGDDGVVGDGNGGGDGVVGGDGNGGDDGGVNSDFQEGTPPICMSSLHSALLTSVCVPLRSALILAF